VVEVGLVEDHPPNASPGSRRRGLCPPETMSPKPAAVILRSGARPRVPADRCRGARTKPGAAEGPQLRGPVTWAAPALL
jgi:hypothetical protein